MKKMKKVFIVLLAIMPFFGYSQIGSGDLGSPVSWNLRAMHDLKVDNNLRAGSSEPKNTTTSINGTGGGNRQFDTNFYNVSKNSFFGVDDADQGYGYFPVTIISGRTYIVSANMVADNGAPLSFITSNGTNYVTDQVQLVKEFPSSGATYSFDATANATHFGISSTYVTATMTLDVTDFAIRESDIVIETINGNLGVGASDPENRIQVHGESGLFGDIKAGSSEPKNTTTSINGTGGGNRQFDGSFTGASATGFTGTDPADQGYGYFPVAISGDKWYKVSVDIAVDNGLPLALITGNGTNHTEDQVQEVKASPISGEVCYFKAISNATHFGVAASYVSGTMTCVVSNFSLQEVGGLLTTSEGTVTVNGDLGSEDLLVGTNAQVNGDLVVIGDINVDGALGVGTAASDVNVHIFKGSSGATRWLADENLLLESNTTNVINFISPATAENYIMFGKPSASTAGWIKFANADNSLEFMSSGGVDFLDDVYVDGDINTTGEYGIDGDFGEIGEAIIVDAGGNQAWGFGAINPDLEYILNNGNSADNSIFITGSLVIDNPSGFASVIADGFGDFGNYVNADLGYKINDSYGNVGQTIVSTGTGSEFGSGTVSGHIDLNGNVTNVVGAISITTLKPGTGSYTIIHNLGSGSNYNVIITPETKITLNMATYDNKDDNDFDVDIFDHSTGIRTNGSFDFIIHYQ